MTAQAKPLPELAPPAASGAAPLVSVIIPTYNRESALRRTLGCLAAQTLPATQFEVWLVDDGSIDGTPALAKEPLPFSLRYERLNRGGPTLARNWGAAQSRGAVLIFMDDDICPAPSTLASLAAAVQAAENTIWLGQLSTPAQAGASAYARLMTGPQARQAEGRPAASQGDDLLFTACLTGLLAIRRADFESLGGFQDPTGGWPNWDDVDFGYRARLAGYRLRQSSAAAEHWDYAALDLAAACQRWERASHAAPRLLAKYPTIQPALPMFTDKGPVNWRQDPPALAARKLARHLASSNLALGMLKWVTAWFERHWPNERALRPLYRWITGAHIFRGYRRGLKDLECSTQ